MNPCETCDWWVDGAERCLERCEVPVDGQECEKRSEGFDLFEPVEVCSEARDHSKD